MKGGILPYSGSSNTALHVALAELAVRDYKPQGQSLVGLQGFHLIDPYTVNQSKLFMELKRKQLTTQSAF